MFELKPLSIEAIPAALAEAERYRLLNEPDQAESICEDILAADATNHQARVVLLLPHLPGAGGRGRYRCSALHRRAPKVLPKHGLRARVRMNMQTASTR